MHVRPLGGVATAVVLTFAVLAGPFDSDPANGASHVRVAGAWSNDPHDHASPVIHLSGREKPGNGPKPPGGKSAVKSDLLSPAQLVALNDELDDMRSSTGQTSSAEAHSSHNGHAAPLAVVGNRNTAINSTANEAATTPQPAPLEEPSPFDANARSTTGSVATETTASATTAAAAAVLTDGWSAPITVRTADGRWANPVHAALMGDGSVVFVGVVSAAEPTLADTAVDDVSWRYVPTPLGISVPPTLVAAEVPEPLELDGVVSGDAYIEDGLICMGAVHTADGRLVAAGGTRRVVVVSTGETVVFGLETTAVYANGAWTRQSGTMVGTAPYGTFGRWYPSVTRMSDGRIMVFGGHEFVAASGLYTNLSSEMLTLPAGTRSLYSAHSNTSSLLAARDYTAETVLPSAVGSADLLMIGEFGYPVLANSAVTEGWVAGRAGRPGVAEQTAINWGVSTTMLPIRLSNAQWGYNNGAVLLAGGYMGTSAGHSADVFDAAVQPGWRVPSVELGGLRHHGSTVVLPDGRVLLINGHDPAGGTHVTAPQYIDPANGFSVTPGSSSGIVRGYHNIALLLPDGRILVGGGRDQVTLQTFEKPTLQFYSPDYLSKTRPVITAAPTSVKYGRTFSLSVTGPRPTEAVLVSLGSMTHSVDMDQRSVQIRATVTKVSANGTATVSAVGPASGRIAPPGDYMLFVLDANRVPSIAKIVRIS